ncbi:hypothetical protein [Nitrospira sp. Nam80]
MRKEAYGRTNLLALQWRDIDWQGRFIEVRRNYTHRRVTTPKSGERAGASTCLGN